MLMSHLMAIIIALALRFLLSRENKRRDAMREESEKTGEGRERFESWMEVEVEKKDEKGGVRTVREKVDKNFLDLTDGENLAFRYVL